MLLATGLPAQDLDNAQIDIRVAATIPTRPETARCSSDAERTLDNPPDPRDVALLCGPSRTLRFRGHDTGRRSLSSSVAILPSADAGFVAVGVGEHPE